MRPSSRKVLLFASAIALVAVPTTATTAQAAPTAQSGPAAVQRVAASGIDPSRLRPGWTVAGDEIVWDNGAVRTSLVPTAAGDCDSGFLCVWDDSNFGGRRLQFQAAGLRNMDDYGFGDKMSSWYNRNSVDARWYYDKGGSGTSRCMDNGVRASSLGGDSDEMSSLRVYSSSSVC